MELNAQVKEDDRPKWLLELENRKRKPRLAHEVGAGSPCIKCESNCPGLDLHFWRKICKNCKCGHDDHDVPIDEFPQFDLLFGSSGKSKRKLIVLKINKQQVDNEETFEWAPPDTTKELAADYMKALPEDKLPIKGSVGAALRKQQLQKQLPLHDIDHKVCDELSDSERKQFEKYLENLKKYVGQGKVSKIITAKPFEKSLVTPANASECFTPKHKPSLINSQPLNLRTPSSFIPKSMKSSYSTPLASQEEIYNPNLTFNTSVNDPEIAPRILETLRGPLLGQITNDSHKMARYHHIIENMKNEGKVAAADSVSGNRNFALNISNITQLPHDEKCYPIGSMEQNLETINNNPDNEQIRTDTVVPTPSSIIDSIHSNNHNLPLNFAQSNLHSDNYQKNENINKNKSQTEFNALDFPQWSTKLTTPSINSCESISQENKNSLLADKLLSDALLPPSAINSADIIGSTLDEKELSYIREKLSSKYSGKEEEPIDINNLSRSRELIRDNGEEKNIKSYLNHNAESNNQNIHSKPIHAHLSSCNSPGNSIIRSEQLNNPVFPEEAFGKTKNFERDSIIDNLSDAVNDISINQSKVQKCHKCQEGIVINDVVVTAEKAKNAVWHPGCFACSTCNELLVDLVYFYYKDKLYCARDLANLLEIPRCFACDELIFVREYTVAEGHNYHVKHFCCWDCDVPLAGQQYISENDRPLCLVCYQKTYAKICDKCRQVIAADQQGVAVKNLNFHASDECFCCATCKKSLLNGRMAIREDKPFCCKECITVYLNTKK
ncbi:testin [Microplitis mediator]|uniref:testin n=1 Tax=Microplitis mediator TaxID=375433 RepID=UPI002553AE25|nr:testin [Microplitis mediator]